MIFMKGASEMIRILHMTGSLNWSGIATVVMNYYRHVDRNQVQFDFITDSIGKTRFGDEIESMGGRIFRVPSRNRRPFAYGRALGRLFREHPEYRVFHVHGSSASMYMDLHVAKKAGVPVRIGHSHAASCYVKWQHYMFRPFVNGVCTHRFACSLEAGRWVFGKKRDVGLIKNAIDLDTFRFDPSARKELRSAYGIDDDTLVLGHIGTLAPNKNHDFLLDVFAGYVKTNDNARLFLVGGGPVKDALVQKAQALGMDSKVIFFGNTETPQTCYSAFDVFVFPSRFEGLGLVAVEAAACGLPCLISDTVPGEVMVADWMRRLPIRDPADWVRALAELNRTRAAPEDALAQIERSGYNIKKAAQALQEFYVRQG